VTDSRPPAAGAPGQASLTRGQAQVASTSFLALFAIVGVALYGLPFFYDFFVRELGWTRQQVTSGNAFSKLLVGPLFGFAAGWVIDRFGPRRVMLAGILMGGGALVGLGFTSTLALFYVCYLFNALGYVCGGPLPAQVLLSRWFDRHRGKAMGFAYLGIGIGGAIVPILAYRLTQAFGWRSALVMLGVLMIAIAFPIAWFVREWPVGHVEPQQARRAPLAPLGPALRTPAFYLILAGSMCSIGAIGGTIQNLKLYLSLDGHYEQVLIARVLSVVLVGSLVGRILMGYLADRWARRHVMLLIYSIVATSIPLLIVADSPVGLYVFALAFGVGLGGDYMIIPLMAADLFGVQALGRLLGIVLTADGIAEAVMPMAVAAIRDRTGSYDGGFALLVVLAALGAIAVSLLPRPPRTQVVQREVLADTSH
jgi:MFS family permease